MSFHKIKNVEALDNFTLQVLFESGEKRFYDLNKLIEVNKDFEILKRDKNLFKLVKIDIQGYGIYWNDYLDISCDEIYYNNWKIKYLIYIFYIKKLVIANLDKGVAIQTKWSETKNSIKQIIFNLFGIV